MSARAVGVAFGLALAALAAQRPLLVDSRKSPTPLDTAAGPRLLVADLDGDGIVDIARSVCSRGASLWRGVGGGRFAAVSGAPEAIFALADLDLDGDLDLIAAQALYRNDGNWRFTAIPGFLPPTPLVHGDLDGDGDIDLIAGARVFLTTAPFVLQEAPGRLPLGAFWAPILIDVDGDGDLDVAYDGDSGARLFLNDGRAFFAEVTATHLPATRIVWVDVTAADLDLDGDLDLVVALGINGVRVLVNDGAGRFTERHPGLYFDVTAVAAGDIDGDGDADLVLGTSRDGGVLVENRGAQFFRLDPARWSAPRHPIGVLTLADVDSDGDLDILCAGPLVEWGGRCGPYDGLETDVAYNDGGGTFQPGRPPALEVAIENGYAAVSDLDGDGVLDALITEGLGWLLRGDGRGGFGSPRALQLPVAGRPSLGDIDGDGDLDAVLASGAGLHVLFNPGNGVLAASHTHWLPALPGIIAAAVALADLDGDGDLDCAVATLATDYLYPQRLPDLVYWNDGTGRYTLAPNAIPDVPTESFDIRAGDLDGDGDIDLVVNTTVYINLRPGKFDVLPLPFGSGTTRQIALADLDGDGRLDIVFANDCPTRAPCLDGDPEMVFWNEGGGRFTYDPFQTVGHTHSVAVFDADGDGDLDLLFGNATGRNAAENNLFVNLGGRRFQWMRPGVDFPSDWDNTMAMGAGDLDHDGDTDVVLFNSLPGSIRSRVYLNATRQLTALDSLAPARPYRLRIHGGEHGAVLLLAAQGARIPTPFGLLGLDLRTTVTFGIYGPPAPGDVIALDLVMPNDPNLIGNTLWWQALVGDNSPLGARLTNTVREVGTPQ